MKLSNVVCALFVFLFLPLISTHVHASDGVTEWTIDGDKRTAMIVAPAKKTDGPVPVVLVFHGHSGTIKSCMEMFNLQKDWPEALVVYPQGLPTATSHEPAGRESGWQQKIGINNDRDLKFVDAILKDLGEKYPIDTKRIFATGHSNGGMFSYLLGMTRSKTFAAIAPSAAVVTGLGADKEARPVPVLHFAGKSDTVALFENQMKSMDAVRKRNQCEAEGTAWATVGDLVATLYPSKVGAPFVAAVFPGGHKYPDGATELIVRFFKEQTQAK